MRTFDIVPNQFRVADLLSWQRDGTLDLNPAFQRRSVWKRGAKGYLVDTVAKGLPIPLLFLRERLDLGSQRMRREVVDGQQRLRTLFSFIDPKSLPDFNPKNDAFTVLRSQNLELAGKPFARLDRDVQNRLLSYKFSVQVLPPEMDDRDVLQVFARINSTGIGLNSQELRNAAYFGEFKALMYSLAYEQFERWRDWRIISDDQLSRMIEVELVSDLVLNMMEGLNGRSKPRLDRIYEKYDAAFPEGRYIADRFRTTMDTIDSLLGSSFTSTIYTSEIHFFTLFVYLYDRLWGLGSAIDNSKPRALPKSLRAGLMEVSERFELHDIPAEVVDAVARSSTDLGRRRTRFRFTSLICASQE